MTERTTCAAIFAALATSPVADVATATSAALTGSSTALRAQHDKRTAGHVMQEHRARDLAGSSTALRARRSTQQGVAFSRLACHITDSG